MIEIKNVSYQYTGNELKSGGIFDINLSVKKGECILLCGRSGCGKTTITRLLNHLIPEYYPGRITGEVLLDNKAVDQFSMYEVSEKVGSVFQNPRTQFFNVDVTSEIVFGMENQAVPQKQMKKRLSKVIQDLGLEKLAGRSIFELSGGEKQKVAFASVYAMNPEIYLLDEPSSNLDMKTIQELKQYLEMIKVQGKTILIAEHRIHYLMDVVDRVVYLENGEMKFNMDKNKFALLPVWERNNMGLRAIDTQEVHPKYQKKEELRSVWEQKNDDMLLEARNVSLCHKKKSIINGISFQAHQREIIAVTGENGCGKTTFLRTLAGLHKEYTGSFLIDGKLADDKKRCRISYLVMQDVNYELFADSVKNECILGIKNPDEEMVEHTLKELDLLDFQNKHPNTLSGGQKQRVAVAVSIITKKSLLIFDEPTSGLDFDSMKRVAGLIQDMSKDKIIFVVTHDYEFICQACSRVLHFDKSGVDIDVPVTSENEEKIKCAVGIQKTVNDDIEIKRRKSFAG